MKISDFIYFFKIVIYTGDIYFTITLQQSTIIEYFNIIIYFGYQLRLFNFNIHQLLDIYLKILPMKCI